MANKYMNKHLTSLSIKEMQIKTILRFHLTEIPSSQQQTTNAGENGGGRGPLYTVGRNVN
jgi:hypothetical protein